MAHLSSTYARSGTGEDALNIGVSLYLAYTFPRRPSALKIPPRV